MKLSKILLAVLILHFFISDCLYAQKGIPCSTCKLSTPLNANAGIATSYTASACGLNYVQGSVALLRRSTTFTNVPVGVVQPAPISISGLPAGAQIIKAFLYADASGNGVVITATLENPLGVITNFPMTLIGTDVDKCWTSAGYAGSYTYRSDVTSRVTGNGTYRISGLPVYPASGPNDVDGATLLIIYTNPAANYNGTLIIADGAHASVGATYISDNVSGFTGSASTSGNAFVILSDLQQIGSTAIGFNCPSGTYNYTLTAGANTMWNFVQTNTVSVTNGQTSAVYSVNSFGMDCFSLVAAGLYFQTNCGAAPSVPNSEVTIYNSFSPNGDGLNDVFEIDNIASNLPNHVYVYNRWGILLWEAGDYDNIRVVWDGKDKSGNLLSAGTYYYLVQIEGKNTEKHWVELIK